MTSNLGSNIIRENFEKLTRHCESCEERSSRSNPERNGLLHSVRNDEREKIIEETKNEVLDLLKKTIRPEFLNRIDEVIMFSPLDEAEIKSIVLLQLNSVKKLLEGNGVDLQFTDAAVDLISEEGYDPQFGARPVKRVIQRQVLNPLSKAILAKQINQNQPIVIDVENGELHFAN